MSISQNFPNTRPSLNLNFARSKTLDPRITFSRPQTGNGVTYVGEDGLIKYASADEPRFDHDPETGESLGLLIEESRTNRTTYSDYSTVILQNVSASSTVSTSAPDGSSIFAFEANNNTSVTHRIVLTNGNTGNATTPHVASFFIKIPPIGSDQLSSQNVIRLVVRWRSSAGSGTGAVIFYTHSTQQWGISGGVNAFGSTAPSKYDPTSAGAYFEQWNNGWVKFVFPGAISSNNSGETYNSYDWNISETSVEQGGNCTVFLWGAQFEQGSFPTSYIPTSGSTATRNPDNVTMTGDNFSDWYNQSEGTVYADTRVVGVQTGRYDRLWAITNSNLNLEGISVFTGGPGFNPLGRYVSSITITNSATEQVGSNSYTTQGAVQVPNAKYAFAFKENDANMGFNGNVFTTDTNVGIITADRLLIGQPQRYQGYSCMTVSQLTYYPVRLPNSTLQTLTK